MWVLLQEVAFDALVNLAFLRRLTECFGLDLRGPLFRLHDDLDKTRSLMFHCACKLRREFVN